MTTTKQPYTGYIARFQDKTVQSVLLDRINVVKKILEIVSAVDKWTYRYAPEKWDLKQLIQHCIDAERIFSYRALHLARQDAQPIFGFDENAYADLAVVGHKSGEALMYEYILLMESIRFQFDGFEPADLQRCGRVADTELTVEDIGFIIAGHSLHHMDIIIQRYLE
ncbi:DinB family protein [Flavobacterium sp. JP2137]|uniref:DinB family protein n=1 Tax=Flavobacterium sp. JP2137 TaxID=3414510 RepID=UPI003D2FBC5F